MIGEVMREGEASADHSGELRAVAARSEQPDRRKRHVLRHGAHGAERVPFRETAALEQDQFLKPLQKVVIPIHLLPTPQRIRCDGVGSRRAPQAEVDATGKQRFQHLEPLGDHQWGVVGQHDAAGSHAHALRRYRDLPDHDVGRGARNRRKIVMLGDPIARVTEPVGDAGKIDRVAQRDGAGGTGGDRRKIED